MEKLKFTRKLLESLNACESGIRFVEQNKLVGFPFSLLPEVKGDSWEYMLWINRIKKIQRSPEGLLEKIFIGKHSFVEYDIFGNSIRSRFPGSSTIETMDYDIYGNIIRSTKSTGFWKAFEYDFRGRMVRYTNSFNSEQLWVYDDIGNCIKFTDSNGYSETFESGEYEKLRDVSPRKDPETEYEFYSNGQLHKIVKSAEIVLEFPKF
ncbi:hypothetical protein HN499_05870 [archaeon]|nr:hypothetical protein [archaeon]